MGNPNLQAVKKKNSGDNKGASRSSQNSQQKRQQNQKNEGAQTRVTATATTDAISDTSDIIEMTENTETIDAKALFASVETVDATDSGVVNGVVNEVVNIPLQAASLDIWDKKYRLKTRGGENVDKSIDDTYQRVAKALAYVEKPSSR